MEILKLYPVCKNYIWGGMKLKEIYGKQTELTPVAESWELSFHPDGPTRVADGRTLEEVLPREMWGENGKRFDRFPMLIKLIDAAQNLSVQVHPSDAYALANENSYGKTEAWYIVAAEPGAGIYLGFKRDVTPEEYEGAIKDGTLTDLLHFYEVKPGECYFIPAGTIHAIGAGCLICEVQQNSNLTYRVFDYGRVDKNGNPRELHVEKALRVTNLKKYEKLAPLAGVSGQDVLAECEYFRATRLVVRGKCEKTVGGDSFLSLTCMRGEGEIVTHAVRAGESFLVPAGYGALQLSGDMELLCAEIPEVQV